MGGTMTWNQHIPVTAEKKYAERLDTGVKIGINRFGRSQAVYRTLISLTPDVAERLFKVKDQQAFAVRVYIGDGENKGKVRIVGCKRMEEGAILATYNKAGKKGWYRLQLGEVPVFPVWPQPMKMCKIQPYEQDEVLVLTLPEWEKQPLTPREAVNRKPQVGPGTKPLPMAIKPVTTTETPLKPMLPVATNRKELDAAAARAKDLIPAPNFSGVQKPKLSRAQALARIGKL
jgi:hypothetical protein